MPEEAEPIDIPYTSEARTRSGLVLVLVLDLDGTDTDPPIGTDDALDPLNFGIVGDELDASPLIRADYPDLVCRLWGAAYIAGDTTIDNNSGWTNSAIGWVIFCDRIASVAQVVATILAEAETAISPEIELAAPVNVMLGVAGIESDPTAGDDIWQATPNTNERFEGDRDDYDNRIVYGRYLTGLTWNKTASPDKDIAYLIELVPA